MEVRCFNESAAETIRETCDAAYRRLAPEEVEALRGISADLQTIEETPTPCRVTADTIAHLARARDRAATRRPALNSQFRASDWEIAGEHDIAALLGRHADSLGYD